MGAEAEDGVQLAVPVVVAPLIRETASGPHSVVSAFLEGHRRVADVARLRCR